MTNEQIAASETNTTPPTAPTLKGECDDIRIRIKLLEKNVRDLKDKIAKERRGQEDAFPGQSAEVLGQVTIAFRHLEDARMRIGKVIQYSGDGVSVFDKEGA